MPSLISVPSKKATLSSAGNYSGALHNFLQDKKESHLLSWAEIASSASNPTQWTVHCKIGGEIMGTGVAFQKAVARQAAAKQACIIAVVVGLVVVNLAAWLSYLIRFGIVASDTKNTVAVKSEVTFTLFLSSTMEQTASEKVDAGLLPAFPPSRSSKRGMNATHYWILWGLMICSACVYVYMEDFVANLMVKKHEPQCSQSAILLPETNRVVWEALGATFGTEVFKERAVNWLGGAVRIPTETYDNMGPVGEDERWNVFAVFQDYLLGAFPLVHTTLQLTKVNGYGLLYIWEGSNTSLKPILLAAHQDVVPVDPSTVDKWEHPPYSGYFDGRRIWGRGSSDDKSGLIGSLASVESLIRSGFHPTRTVILAYGFDEEVSGRQGAQQLADTLHSLYGKNSMAFIVDEGGGFLDEYGSTFAIPGVAEKGYFDVHIEVTTPGGHSSVPPKHTSIGILSALLVELEHNPYRVELSRNEPLYSMIQCIGEHAKDLSKDLRKTIKQSTNSKKALRKLEQYVLEDPVYRSLTGTTQAIDIIQGGVKANALPENAWALVNHRISVSSSVEDVKKHAHKLFKPLARKFNLTYDAFGTEISDAFNARSSGSLTLGDAYGTALEPAPVTPTSKGSAPYELLSGTIRATYNSHRGLQSKNAIFVSPGMSTGNTDTRYYWGLSKHIFRYNHNNGGKETNRLANIHTVNEAIEADAFMEMILFFTTLILNSDEATDL